MRDADVTGVQTCALPISFRYVSCRGDDRVAREAGALLVDLLAGDDRGSVVCDQEKEGSERLVEPKLHGEVVDETNSGDVADAARDEGVRATDLLEHPGPFALRRPLEGVLHVGRLELAPVVEADTPTELERVDALVGRHGPAPRQGRD